MDKSTIFQQVQKILLFRDFPHNIKLSTKLKDNLHMDNFDYAVLKTGYSATTSNLKVPFMSL